MSLVEVGDEVVIDVDVHDSYPCDTLTLFFTVPYSSFHQNDYHPFRLIQSHALRLETSCEGHYHYVPASSLGEFTHPGYYDWLVKENTTGARVKQGRFVVLPKGTRAHRFYEIPSDLEVAKRADPSKATKSTFSFLMDMIPSLKEKGVDVVSIGVSPAHASSLHLLQSDSNASEQGLLFSSDSSPLDSSDSYSRVGLSLQSSESELSSDGETGFESVKERDSAVEHAKEGSTILSAKEGSTLVSAKEKEGSTLIPTKEKDGPTLVSPSRGVEFGTLDELKSCIASSSSLICLTRSLKEHHMTLMLPVNPNTTSDHTPHRSSVLCDSGDGLKPHPGTDGYETQWENEMLPNYRLVDAVRLLSRVEGGVGRHDSPAGTVRGEVRRPHVLSPRRTVVANRSRNGLPLLDHHAQSARGTCRSLQRGVRVREVDVCEA